MSQTEELSRREEQFLENVLENLRQRIGKIAQELEEGQKDIESMHEYYWENYTEMDQYGYEDYDNQQALLHRINANQEKLDLKHRFQKMLDSPFFGRVDFIYEGEEEAEPFYIGIGNFAQRTGCKEPCKEVRKLTEISPIKAAHFSVSLLYSSSTYLSISSTSNHSIRLKSNRSGETILMESP